MSRLRFLVGVLVLFGVGVILAQPDQPAVDVPRSAFTRSLVYLSDAGLLKELGVDEAGGKQLVEHRNSWYPKYTEVQVGIRNDAAKLRAFYKDHEAALAKILKPAQMTRLREIMIQNILANPLRSAGGIMNLVEVTDPLKLDDKQKAQLLAGGEFDKVLTEAQQAILKELQGKPYTGALVGTRPAGAFSDRFRQPPVGGTVPVYVVSEARVQEELRATDEQKQKLVAAARTYQESTKTLFGPLQLKQQKAATVVAETALKETLSAEQAKRLREIVLQRSVRTLGLSASLRSDEMKQLLAPTADQEQRVVALTAETAAAFKKIVLNEDPGEKMAAAVAALRTAHEAKLLDILTPEQKTRWKDALGVAFKDEPAPVRQPPPGGAFGFPGSETLVIPYTLVSDPVVQKALKLTEEQTKQLPTGRTQTPAVRTAVAAVLTPEQVKRLEQLTLQERAQIAGQPYLFRFRVVAETIALTEDQKKQLEPLGAKAVAIYQARDPYTAEQGKADAAALAKILTAEQQDKLKKLLGEPFEGVLPDIRPVRAPGNVQRPVTDRSTLLAWLLETDIQTDLVLIADQVAKVKDTQTTRDAKTKEANTLPRAERTARLTAIDKEVDTTLTEMLTAVQKSRLEQLRLQRRLRTISSRSAVYQEPAIAEALKLTADDLARITRLESDLARVENLIRTEAVALLGEPRDSATVSEITKAFAEKARAEQDKLLTAEQKKRWETLVGKPYAGKFPVATNPFGRFGQAGGLPPGGPVPPNES